MRRYKISFSMYGLIAFILQELPYLPFLLWPPSINPLAGNVSANPFLGLLEQAGGVTTVAFLILVVHHDKEKPTIKDRFFVLAAVCLLIYFICWIFYFNGITNGWLIVIGLSAIVPIYYLCISLWLKNGLSLIASVIFFIGHTVSNAINYLSW